MSTFHVEIIKPSHYDKDGYVIQWWKAWIPSNSMACLHAIATDCAERRVLGDDVSIEVNAYDEMNIKIPIERIANRINQPGHAGLVCLVGVQSNQFPRAMVIARRFRSQGVGVAIGGFHVSGCLAMLKDLTPELQEAVDLGVILYAGEAEEHFEAFLETSTAARPSRSTITWMICRACRAEPSHSCRGSSSSATMESCRLSMPDGAVRFNVPSAPSSMCRAASRAFATRDDIERIIERSAAEGVTRFFITDDNFARNRNWEAIFDRMIELREQRGLHARFLIQVDTLAHKIPNFIDKAARAGCRYAFVGLESINPENLVAMKKNQNRITEYRTMFQAWKKAGVITYAGFIMGLPGDTPETIRRDIEIIQRELPVDLLEFTMLTPLPGSEDHKKLHEGGVWMDPDLNKYDLETTTIEHPRMSREVWQKTYQDMWSWYYTDEHVERLMRRNVAYGINPVTIWRGALQVFGAAYFENVHPQQCGYFRRKDRTQRRPELPVEPAFVFYPRHIWQTAVKFARFGAYAFKLHRMRKRAQNDPSAAAYMDLAISPVEDAPGETLEMFELNDSARAAVEKAVRQAKRHKDAEASVG